MNFFAQAFAFIFDPANFAVANGIGPRLVDHLVYSGLSILFAAVIAVPLGIVVGHTGKGRNVVVAVTSAARAIPTFGLILYIIVFTGLGLWPLVVVLVILAIPPMLAGVYAGFESVDRQVIDAARSVGMSERQIIGRVEFPLAMPLVLGGLRSATLQVIATATIAGYVGLTGLGRFLIEGLARHDFSLAIVGAILVTALALSIDGVLAIIQKLVVPRGVSRGIAQISTRRPLRSSEALATPTTKG